MSQRYKYVGPNGRAPLLRYRIDEFIGFSYIFACMYDTVRNLQVLH